MTRQQIPPPLLNCVGSAPCIARFNNCREGNVPGLTNHVFEFKSGTWARPGKSHFLTQCSDPRIVLNPSIRLASFKEHRQPTLTEAMNVSDYW